MKVADLVLLFKIGPAGCGNSYMDPAQAAATIIDLRGGPLLWALKHDEVLGPDLMGVRLSDTTVRVLRHVAGKVPTAGDETGDNCLLMEGTDTIRAYLGQITPRPDNAVFVRVTTPTVAPAGTIIFFYPWYNHAYTRIGT